MNDEHQLSDHVESHKQMNDPVLEHFFCLMVQEKMLVEITELSERSVIV